MMSSAVQRRQWCQHWQWWQCGLTAWAELASGQFSQILWSVQQSKGTHTDRQKTISNSIGCNLTKPNQPIIQDQSFQDQPQLPKWKLSQISLCMLTCTPKVKTYKISTFETTTPSPCTNYSKSQNQEFQDYHILPKLKLSKICPFKTHPPKGTYPKSVFTRPSHPPKLNSFENQSFQDHHTLPKYKL